ncbi:hypothetical protein KNE206_76670 [Kitasatospora sp. NE20-6]
MIDRAPPRSSTKSSPSWPPGSLIHQDALPCEGENVSYWIEELAAQLDDGTPAGLHRCHGRRRGATGRQPVSDADHTWIAEIFGLLSVFPRPEGEPSSTEDTR